MAYIQASRPYSRWVNWAARSAPASSQAKSRYSQRCAALSRYGTDGPSGTGMTEPMKMTAAYAAAA